MKKKLLFLVAILFVFTLSVFGCGGATLSGGPSLTDTVYGNGGSAVVKGDYLYFANAYYDYNKLGSNDNKYDRDGQLQKNYGIYRIKLNKNGVVDLNSKGVPTGAELLVPQVGGYEKSGLYICGEYLYYTTPYSGYKQGESELTKGLLRFEKIKLNGDDHVILSEGEYTTECEYSINYVDGNTYITVFSDEKVNVIKSQSNGNKSSYKIASSVVDYCVENQETLKHNKATNNVNKYVYYTKKSDNEKYSLYRKHLNGGAEETLISVSSDEITLEAVKNNRVYFKQANILKSSTFELNADVNVYTNIAIEKDATTNIVDYIILDDTLGYAQDRGIVAVYTDSSAYYLYNYTTNGSQLLHTESKQINLVLTTGNEVLFQVAEDEKLYSIDFSDVQNINKKVVLNSFSATIGEEESSTTSFDYDGERIFYFAKAADTNEKLNYLHVALLEGNAYKDEGGNSVGHYIGILDSSDIKK